MTDLPRGRRPGQHSQMEDAADADASRILAAFALLLPLAGALFLVHELRAPRGHSSGDVAAGLAGLGDVLAALVFVLAAAFGFVAALMSRRRARQSRFAATALGLSGLACFVAVTCLVRIFLL